MNKTLIILLYIAFISATKTFLVSGLTATPDQYLDVLLNTKIIEFILWILLALSFHSLLDNRNWFHATHLSSVTKQIVENEESENQVLVTESFTSTPDYENSKKAYAFSKIAFVASLLGTLAASFF